VEPGFEFVHLLADAHRWRILQELSRSDRRVHELTHRLGEPQNLVSYHLRALRDAGLVSSKRSAADGRDTYYRIEFVRCIAEWRSAAAALQPGLELAATAPSPVVSVRRGTRVLFLCTGNSARSQIAEAVLRHATSGRVDARSAGSHPKALHPIAVRVMAERGIDISAATTKHLRRFARTRFDRVVTLCDKVREICPEFPGQPETAHWSVTDPALEGDTDAESYPAFVRTADDIIRRVAVLIAQLSPAQLEVTHG
jgi:protein-tyrosine-phosphatase